MAVPSIRLRRSSTTGAVPTTSQLALGEVAINTFDGKVFIKKDDGSESIVEIGASSSNNVNITNNSTNNETVYLTFVDSDSSGSQGVEVDTNLTYNPSTNILTALNFAGNGSGLTNISNTSEVYITNNSTNNETVYLTFVDSDSSGSQGVEVDTNLTYNPSTNVLTALNFAGNGSSLTSLDASNLGSGTIPDARFPATLPAVSGANLTNLPGGVVDKIEEGNTSAEVIDTGSDGRFIVTTEGTERLRITSAGSVGIGTDNPQANLHISSGTSGDCILRLSADTDDNNENDNPVIEFEQDGGDLKAAIGLGVNDVSDNNSLIIAHASSGSVSTQGIIFKTTNGSDNYTNAVERLRISPDGALGLSGGNYGTSGQVITSNGASSAPTWQDISSTSSGVTVQDEGSALSTTATTLNFVGSGVVATGTGATKTITISGGGGGSSSLATAIYTGPSSSQTVDSTAYSSLDIDTDEGTPDAIFSNTNGTITLGAAGTYLAMCTIVVNGDGSGTNRWTGELEVRQNSTTLGSVQGGYVRNQSGSEETYVSISRIVTTTSSNDTIDFRIRKIGGTSESATLVTNLCTIQIIRLDGIPGIQGPAGNDGADGNDGTNGTDGADGNDGTNGTDGADGPSDIPQNLEVGNYTLVSSDNGKHIRATGTGAITIPSTVFSAGNAITIFNDTTSDKTITQGTSVTLRLAGTATTGDRTLATYGLCSLLCVSSNEFVISGAGLT